ncbi:MAG: hypothetical protein K0Q51_1076 [Rickettsiaceae bacterium]|nr:hypothetical protein [Rickettsiaceae bacterium]
MKFIVAFAIFFLSSISVAKETSNVLIRNIADATTIKNKYISDKITNNGPLEAKNSTIHKLKVNGPVQAENLNSNKIKIDGSLQGKNVTSSQVQVQGPTILERTTIEELKVTGQAEVKDHSRITYIEACGHLKVEDSKVVHLKLDSNQC